MAFNPDAVIETFQAAAEENSLSPMRANQVVHLPAEGEMFIAGDLHDHRRNLEKLLHIVDLENNPQRQLILQEVVHGDHWDPNGAEESWITLAKVADLKCQFPNQVHFIFANHDLAQIHGEGIMKSGQSVCAAFNKGVKRDFGPQAGPAHAAITEFLLSFPLAIRTANGLFMSHSLPSDKDMPNFDYSVLDRALSGPDYARVVGPVYQLIWGRRTTPPMVDQFLERVGANLIITGHQPQEMGFAVNGPKHLIIASDHNQGVFVRVDLAAELTLDSLTSRMRKFVSIELPSKEETASNDIVG